MSEQLPGTSGPRREPNGPPEMSVAEKLACEWEARHDVAARHRVADLAPVQHYLSHVRAEASRHAPAGPAHHQAAEREEERQAASVPPALRGWLRWGEEGPSAPPVIPRC